MKRRNDRRGIAIGLVLIFSIIVLIFGMAMVFTRVERKRQTKTTLQHLRAHYFALGAHQHALLKVRMLPNICYYASCLQKGICPFYALQPGTAAPAGGVKSEEGMDGFKLDVSTAAFQIECEGMDYEKWHYDIPTLKVMSIFRRPTGAAGDEMTVYVLKIVARATVFDGLQRTPERTELVERVVEIERK